MSLGAQLRRWRLRAEFLRPALENGLFTFDEHHVCINSPKYISPEHCSVTFYSRTHMEKCCVKFTSHLDDNVSSGHACLCRDLAKSIHHELTGNFQAVMNKALLVSENKKELERIEEVRLAIFPLDFK